ncbi:MAG TPA: heavy-metal-associated domain-containing protein [Anaerolineae bacterium]|nr:heavy-metal-associated domain-containing protein [Anaerolineae bacterium]
MDEQCHVEPLQKVATDDERSKTPWTLLAVYGMGCPNCANRVRNSLISLNGVMEAHVDHTMGIANVEFNPDRVTIPALINAVARAGGDGRHEYRAQLAE